MKTYPKFALITGGNKGLGFEICRQLAAEGFSILVGARDPVRGQQAVDKLTAEGGTAHALVLDVTSAASIAHAVLAVQAISPILDVLVNNAGIVEDGNLPPLELSIADMRGVYETNLFGPVAMIQAFLPLLRESAAGRIVNMSSSLSSLQRLSDPLWEYSAIKPMGYCTSKTALNATMVITAHALKDTRIKINNADPGYCATDLNGHSGPRSVEQGARIAVKLATLPEDGPSGGVYNDEGTLAW
jgi:NAD(P)-dependent dehydrogenase (short-subunit alcohol dehydrogenase family)